MLAGKRGAPPSAPDVSLPPAARKHDYHRSIGPFTPTPPTIEHVRLDHRRRDVGMSEQFLHSADVVSALEQMGGNLIVTGALTRAQV